MASTAFAFPRGSRVECVRLLGGGGGGVVVGAPPPPPLLLAVLHSVLEGSRWSSTLSVAWVTAAQPLGGAGAPPAFAHAELSSTAACLAARAGGPHGAASVLVGDDTGTLRLWHVGSSTRASASASPSSSSSSSSAPPPPDAQLAAPPLLLPQGAAAIGGAAHHDAVVWAAWSELAAGGGGGGPSAALASLDAAGALALWSSAGCHARREAPSLGCRSAISAAACLASAPGAAATAVALPLLVCGRRDGLLQILSAGGAATALAAPAVPTPPFAELGRGRLAPSSSGAVTALALLPAAAPPGASAEGALSALLAAGLEDGALAVVSLRVGGTGDARVATLSGLRSLRLHSLPVRALAFAPPVLPASAVALLASASDDTSAAVLRVCGAGAPPTLAASVLARQHADYASALAFVGAQQLLTGGGDGVLMCHDLPAAAVDAQTTAAAS